MTMKLAEIHFLDETLEVSQKDPILRLKLRQLAIQAIRNCNESLKANRKEMIHWFVSPHVSPRDLDIVPYGFSFVIPDKTKQYDQGVIKAITWIMKGERLVADMKMAIFFSNNPRALIAIGDNEPTSIVQLADDVRLHMRQGLMLTGYLEQERPIVTKEIFPLLNIAPQ